MCFSVHIFPLPQFYSQRWNHLYFEDTFSYGYWTRYTWFEWYEESKMPRPPTKD
jgi:hypothetical protein